MENNAPDLLLLCEDEKTAQLEKRSLRDAGYPVARTLTSGIEAAKLLAGLAESQKQPEIVVCSQKLADMDGEQFCAIVRQHPLLLGFPILLVLPNDDEAEQLKTLGCGASALLGRPYSIDKLKTAMKTLETAIPRQKMLKAAARQVDTSAFDSALTTYGILLRPDREPDDYFQVGMRCLEERRWNLAISAFEHALRHAQIKAEAELGMAAAFKGKGDMAKMKEWLAQASRTFVAARRWHHARAAYAKLLRHDPGAKSPFITEAHRLIRLKKYDDAAGVLAQGAELLPARDAGDRYARLCFAAEDPEAMLKALEEGFTAQKTPGAQFLASEIRQSLDILARERERQKRELAAERKWQLAQSLAKREKSSPPIRKPAEVAPEQTVSLLDEDIHEGDLPELDDEVNMPPVLEPLSEREATSELFEKKPRLNEFLSVVKLTWKLARRDKKNDN